MSVFRDTGTDYSYFQKIWKFDSAYDFMYGFAVGQMSGLALGYFRAVLKRPLTDEESSEIKEVVESRAGELRDILAKLKTGGRQHS